MTFTDWDYSGDSGNDASLDTGKKVEGNGSLRLNINASGSEVATRKNFSSTQLQVILYTATQARSVDTTRLSSSVSHTSYGSIGCLSGTADWTRFRVTFWYDSTTNTRFGRLEKWDSSTNSWVQQGNDVNFGTGAPAPGSLQLIGYANYLAWIWFDDVYVYTT